MITKLQALTSYVLFGLSSSAIQLPEIPKDIKSESTLAVLFLILVFFAFGIYMLAKAPSILETWRKPLIEHTLAIEKLTSAINAEVEESRKVRASLYGSVVPSLSGLTIAYLELAKMLDLAEQARKDNPDARFVAKKRRANDADER